MKKSRENGSDDHGERKKGRGKKKMKILVMDILVTLQIAHITKDWETRENSGALRTVALIHANAKRAKIRNGPAPCLQPKWRIKEFLKTRQGMEHGKGK